MISEWLNVGLGTGTLVHVEVQFLGRMHLQKRLLLFPPMLPPSQHSFQVCSSKRAEGSWGGGLKY